MQGVMMHPETPSVAIDPSRPAPPHPLTSGYTPDMPPLPARCPVSVCIPAHAMTPVAPTRAATPR